MFNDFSEILKEFLKKLLSSRLVILSVVFVGLYAILGMRLFKLQIIEGEQFQENYMEKTEKKISLTGTRGNIYDRNGNLLAYNKLSYNVTLQDNGDYKRSNNRNRIAPPGDRLGACKRAGRGASGKERGGSKIYDGSPGGL